MGTTAPVAIMLVLNGAGANPLVHGRRLGEDIRALGVLGVLPAELLDLIMLLLDACSVASFARTCKGALDSAKEVLQTTRELHEALTLALYRQEDDLMGEAATNYVGAMNDFGEILKDKKWNNCAAGAVRTAALATASVDPVKWTPSQVEAYATSPLRRMDERIDRVYNRSLTAAPSLSSINNSPKVRLRVMRAWVVFFQTKWRDSSESFEAHARESEALAIPHEKMLRQQNFPRGSLAPWNQILTIVGTLKRSIWSFGDKQGILEFAYPFFTRTKDWVSTTYSHELHHVLKGSYEEHGASAPPSPEKATQAKTIFEAYVEAVTVYVRSGATQEGRDPAFWRGVAVATARDAVVQGWFGPGGPSSDPSAFFELVLSIVNASPGAWVSETFRKGLHVILAGQVRGDEEEESPVKEFLVQFIEEVTEYYEIRTEKPEGENATFWKDAANAVAMEDDLERKLGKAGADAFQTLRNSLRAVP